MSIAQGLWRAYFPRVLWKELGEGIYKWRCWVVYTEYPHSRITVSLLNILLSSPFLTSQALNLLTQLKWKSARRTVDDWADTHSNIQTKLWVLKVEWVCLVTVVIFSHQTKYFFGVLSEHLRLSKANDTDLPHCGRVSLNNHLLKLEVFSVGVHYIYLASKPIWLLAARATKQTKYSPNI